MLIDRARSRRRHRQDKQTLDRPVLAFTNKSCACKVQAGYATQSEAGKADVTLESRFLLLQIAVRDVAAAERYPVELPVPWPHGRWIARVL